MESLSKDQQLNVVHAARKLLPLPSETDTSSFGVRLNIKMGKVEVIFHKDYHTWFDDQGNVIDRNAIGWIYSRILGL